MARRLQLAPAALLAALLALPAAADSLDRLRQELAHKTDPADRAKVTVKIGEELLKRAGRKYKDGAYTEGDALLEEYFTAVRAAAQELLDSGLDARRHPKGFKHLEIHLRKSRRRLDDIARALPLEARNAVDETMHEVESLRLELLSALMKSDLDPSAQEPERKQHL